METNNRSVVFETLTKFLFALLIMGSVFVVSANNYDLYDTYRKYWTITGGALFLIVLSLFKIHNKGKTSFSIVFFLKTVFGVGLLESLYALAQYIRLLPSYNRYFSYTGSFENPAVFAMLLSLCVPIGVYWGFKTYTKRSGRIIWALSLMMFVFIGFSESRTGLIAATISSLIVIVHESKAIRNIVWNKRSLFIIIPIGLALLFLLYRFKADSANGRLLMWRVCWEMIKDKPIFGFGLNGFTAHYMQYQAEFLELHPDSPFILLADNVNNPFNEYLLVLVNFGITGFLVLLFFLSHLFRKLLQQQNEYRFLLVGLTLAIMIWSFFSYPFSMPFIWVVTVLIIITPQHTFQVFHDRLIGGVVVVLSIIGIALSVCFFVPEREWKVISQRSLMGETEVVLPDYERLYNRLKRNGNFLYNYGAELHFSKHYQESLNILEECESMIYDYDVLMLKADCYQNLGDTLSALANYDYAAKMVPSKYLPHYCVMNIYLSQRDTINAIITAKSILSKDVKVDRSKTVKRIIRESQDLVNRYNELDSM